MVAAVTLFNWHFQHLLGTATICLIYLLPVLFSAVRWGNRPSFATAVVSILAFDFLFTQPVFTLVVNDIRYVCTFIIFLVVAFLTGGQAERLHREAELARQREEAVRALYDHNRELEEQARRADLLAESDRLRNALFNSVSHELRTPLSFIIGAVSSLLESDVSYAPDAQRDLLAAIRDGATRMDGLVGNLLDTARIESGMLRLKAELCDMEDILGATLKRLEDALGARKLSIQAAPDLPLVKVDFVLIEQALANILENAVKYSRPMSEIAVTASAGNGSVEISVANEGEEFPPAETSRIFDKFYRGSHHGGIEGMGLGLSVCKAIVAAHNGTVKAQSRKGGGLTVTLALPAAAPEEVEMPHSRGGVQT
jgi:K+-sensing histidine kinase KdpD